MRKKIYFFWHLLSNRCILYCSKWAEQTEYISEWLHTCTFAGINWWFVSCACADPGLGLLHDDVLSGSESRNLLRLAIDLSALQRTWCVSHQRGTDIDPPSSSSSSISSASPKDSIQRLSSRWHSLSIVTSSQVFSLTINKHSVRVIPELVPMVCSVSKANFCDTFYDAVLWTCIKTSVTPFLICVLF